MLQKPVARVVMFALGAVLFSGCLEQKSSTIASFPETKPECQATAVPNTFVIHWKDGSVTVERGLTREEFEKEIFEPHRENIALAEQDQSIALSPMSLTPDSVSELIDSKSIEDSWGQNLVGASAAWINGYRGQGVLVAVIDSGVDIHHPQLVSRIHINANEIADNGIDDDNNGYVDDVSGWDFFDNQPLVGDTSGHGTHVAGIIAADHQQGPVRGLAPEAKILPLDFMNTSGQGNLSDAILAMQYAVQQGARVINASWGGAPCSQSLSKAIDALENQGVIFVAAAGNSGADLDQSPEYPAAFTIPSQITVGASTSRDFTAVFSNFSFNLVHLFAPGAQILSTYTEGRTAALSGTSMAAPFVAGAAAILLSKRPSASAAEVRTALFTSVDRGGFAAITKGRLNVQRALDGF